MFFNNKIHEVASTNTWPWDLMSWIWKKKLLPTNIIKYNGTPCNTLDDLWNALHSSYNSAHYHQVNHEVLREVQQVPVQSWDKFTVQEFQDALRKCNNSSTPCHELLNSSKLIFIFFFFFSFNYVI